MHNDQADRYPSKSKLNWLLPISMRLKPPLWAIGASKASVQPSPESWRVLLDPAGHPFCVTTLIPEV
jgi:Glyoxalase-like domain